MHNKAIYAPELRTADILRAVLFMLLCACATLTGGCGTDDAGESGGAAPATPVRTAQVVRATIETRMHLTGTIQPDTETFIGPKVIAFILLPTPSLFTSSSVIVTAFVPVRNKSALDCFFLI